MRNAVINWFGRSATFATLRIIAQAAPVHCVGLCIWTLWKGAYPVVFIVLIGTLIGKVVDGQQVDYAFLFLIAALFLANSCLGSAGEFLNSAVSWRIARYAGVRFLEATDGPSGIGHLESPALATRLSEAKAHGAFWPALRLVWLLSSILSSRLAGIGLAILLLGYGWWVPLVLLAAAAMTRAWILRDQRAYERGAQRSAPTLRRAAYFRDMALSREHAKELRVFGLLDWSMERFTELHMRGLQELWRARGEGRPLMVASVILLAVAFGVVAAAIAVSATQGAIGVRDLAIYLQAAWGMLALIENPALEYEFYRASRTLPGLFRLKADVQSQQGSPVPNAPAPRPDDAVRGIRFEAVRFAYPGSTREVLSGLDLTIPSGRSLAIVGANGAGKSTLVRLLMRLYEPTSGGIFLDGTPIQEVDPGAWRRQIAVVLQNFCQWELSVRDNVGFGAPHLLQDDAAIWRALSGAGAEHFVRALPRGLETVLSSRYTNGQDLSGGQWQRVALARALLALEGGARILILDEPTSHMDIRAEAEFFDLFLRETRGVTSLLISHRFSTVRCAERIVVVEGGRIAEDGTHDELLHLGGIYSRQFTLQAEPFRRDWREEAVGA